MRVWMVTLLKCPPHSATSGGCALHSPSAQPLPGWTLQSEVLMREAGTCFLLCACVCAWLGLGVPVLGDRGGEGWLKVCGGCGCRAGQGLGCGCPSSADQSGLQPHAGRTVRARPLGPPSPAVVTSGLLLSGLPCQRGQCQVLPLPQPCPEAATVDLPWSLFPGPGPGAFTCHNNNILRIECRWPGPAPGQGAGSWLLFTSNVVPGSEHKCVFWAGVCTVELPPEEVLVPADNFTITFHRHVSGKEQVSLVDPQYLPRRHVKLDPPSDLQSNVSSEHCVLTWSVSPALEPLATLLSYELAFKRQEEAWEWARHKEHIVGVTWLKLEATELDPGSAYEARLRVQMAALEGEVAEEERYEGVWSDWSQPACFATPPRRGRLVPALGQSDSTLVAVSLFLLLSSLTYLLFKLSPRMKTALYQDVPSPGPFFRPLYSVHNGDFQTWIGARGASPQAGRDRVGPPRGALLEAHVREAVALLHCDPADAWPLAGLEEEGGPGPGLPAGVLPAGHVERRAPSPAYLPQEDRAPAGRPRLAPPQCEGSSSDYCALDCSAAS
ncbi:interleukin-9 receptor isoform X1 [Moschus berezovskii]|uniref:interleukin-9 receptor isoform X1 n=1 Tax=Moschus berezovskii TaxID=68408 RepID=UPI002443C1E2|nr:interleukin-9 receptor isoform X1 [Moschus berezovskii]